MMEKKVSEEAAGRMKFVADFRVKKPPQRSREFKLKLLPVKAARRRQQLLLLVGGGVALGAGGDSKSI